MYHNRSVLITGKQSFSSRVAEAARAPFTQISSSVLLGKDDVDHILEHGQAGADTVAARLAEGGEPPRIVVEQLWDDDLHSQAWAGPRL